MEWEELLLKLGFKPKILHSLPGRLRVEVAAIRRIPPEKTWLAHEIMNRIGLPSGISSLEPSFISGSLLFRYDPDCVSQEEVLGYVGEVARLFVRHREQILSAKPEHLPALIDRWKRELWTSNPAGTGSAEEG